MNIFSKRFLNVIYGFMLLVLGVGLMPPAFAQTVTTDTTSSPFPDVDVSYVNADAIQYLKTQGVIQGYPDGNYRPSGEINRAEFAKIVIGSLYSNLKGQNCFPDVKNEWYAPYVCEAKAKGIIEGYPDGTFKPENTINFSEAAKVMVNAYNVSGGQTGGRWFKPYITALESKKDIPLSVEFFDENVKRDAMAEMIYRLKDNVTDKASRTYDEIVGDDFVTVKSCPELKQRYDEQNAYFNTYNTYGGGVRMYETPVAAPSMTTTAAPAGEATAQPAVSDQAKTSQGAATDFSTTNLQVAGVDEADVIKNDGKYIYIIKGDTLRIVEAYPAENLKELVSFRLGVQNETFTPAEMYVDGNQLTVIGSDYREPTPVPMDTGIQQTISSASLIYPPYYNYNRTKVFIVDITDRTKPSVVRSVEFDGSYNTSRKVDGTLYMVMNFYPSPNIYYGGIEPLSTVDYGSTSSSATNTAAYADAIVPRMLDTRSGTEELVAPCSNIRILPKEHNFNYLITAAVPLNDTSKDVSRSVVVGSSDNVYASPNNLYVVANDWGGGFYRPYGDYGNSVYRFALGNGTIEYKNKGKVPGQVLNQFSMDEYNGYFRVATTKNAYVPGSEINNNVYILDMNMQLAGKLENIAPGEKLYSARFMGKKAYLVTFKRVDPFFVLDLSNPDSPSIAGKLKVPGYSDYLEPYDDNHIIGFGHLVDETKVMPGSDFLPYDAMKGFKISLFDVTDLANPKEMYKEVIGERGTTSEILTNHKALLFDKDKQLLAFPITVYEFPQADVCSNYTYSNCPSSCQPVCVPISCTYSNGIQVCTPNCDGANSCVSSETTYSRPVFDGAYVYNISLANGFQLKGRVTHYSTDDQAALITNGYTTYNKTIQRVIYIGENLYSISQAAVKANALADLVEKKMIQLADNIYQVYYGKPVY